MIRRRSRLPNDMRHGAISRDSPAAMGLSAGVNAMSEKEMKRNYDTEEMPQYCGISNARDEALRH